MGASERGVRRGFAPVSWVRGGRHPRPHSQHALASCTSPRRRRSSSTSCTSRSQWRRCIRSTLRRWTPCTLMPQRAPRCPPSVPAAHRGYYSPRSSSPSPRPPTARWRQVPRRAAWLLARAEVPGFCSGCPLTNGFWRSVICVGDCNSPIEFADRSPSLGKGGNGRFPALRGYNQRNRGNRRLPVQQQTNNLGGQSPN